MPGRRAAGLVAALLAAAAAGGCGGRDATVRVGVLADCRSTFGGYYEQFLAGAELPFLERGGRPRGTEPSAGVDGARVGGHPVELVQGCSEFAEFSVLVAEARRLVEREHVDVVVGGLGGSDGVVVRMLAHRYPDVAFVVAGDSRREITTVDPAPNLYRFDLDDAQAAAGLGTDAYRRLRWRRAAIVADDFDSGWAGAAAFAAEFCRAGGRVVRMQWLDPFAKAPKPLATRGVDGVAAFLSPFGASGSAPFVEQLARGLGDPSRRLVLGPWAVKSPPSGASARAVQGATTAVFSPPPVPTAANRAFRREYRRAYPGLPAAYATADLTRTYYVAVQAVMRALAAARGDVGPRLLGALRRVRMPELGVLRLDGDRQAVGRVARFRIVVDGKRVSYRLLGTVAPVDQTLGGALRATEVSRRPPSRCSASPTHAAPVRPDGGRAARG